MAGDDWSSSVVEFTCMREPSIAVPLALKRCVKIPKPLPSSSKLSNATVKVPSVFMASAGELFSNPSVAPTMN